MSTVFRTRLRLQRDVESLFKRNVEFTYMSKELEVQGEAHWRGPLMTITLRGDDVCSAVDLASVASRLGLETVIYVRSGEPFLSFPTLPNCVRCIQL